MQSSPLCPYSIIIPALNEERTIGGVLQALQGLTDDLVVIDGRSRDRTQEIARSYGARVLEDGGKGKGDAVRFGLEVARHPITVFIDADGSHEPAEIPRLVAPIAEGRADLVIGSRMLGGSEELFGSISEVVRLMGGLVISLTINYRYGVRLTDYENGFRAIRTDVGRAIGMTSQLPTIEQEMAMKCLRQGYVVIEVPAHEYRRKGGVSKINVMRLAPAFVWNLLCGIAGPRQQRAANAPAPAGSRPLASSVASDQQAGRVSGAEAAAESPGVASMPRLLED